VFILGSTITTQLNHSFDLVNVLRIRIDNVFSGAVRVRYSPRSFEYFDGNNGIFVGL
jgi:hypothetical protein